MSLLILTCEHCGSTYQRERGREGRGRFCSIRCGRAAQPMKSRDERFWSKVQKSDGCWEWAGHRSTRNYGVLKSGPRGAMRHEYAHRVSWELHFGPIPDGLSVLHHCDNPPCARPDHLFVGTRAANNRDRDRKGRQRSLKGDDHPQRQDPSKVLRGEHHGRAKVTEDQVREIRVRRAAGEKLAPLAAAYGLSIQTTSHICTRRTWKHVE